MNNFTKKHDAFVGDSNLYAPNEKISKRSESSLV